MSRTSYARSFYILYSGLRLFKGLPAIYLEILSTKNSEQQKQPPIGVIRERCFENMKQIYRRTPMPKCDFNKVAKQHIFRTLFLKNTSEWLHLE